MKNIALILFLSIIVFMLGCNDDSDCPVIEPEPTPVETIENIELEVPFITKFGKEHLFINGSDSILIYLGGIRDYRALGADCSSTFGTSAEVTMVAITAEYDYIFESYWPGCDGTNEYEITNPNLPTMEIEGYKLKLMKMYPLSGAIDRLPKSIKDYEIKLVLIN